MPTGHYPGRNYATIENANCVVCGASFTRKRYVHREPFKTCSKACRIKLLHYHRDKNGTSPIPKQREVLERLYVQERRSVLQIAHMFGSNDHHTVCSMLEKFGIKRRRSGPITRTDCLIQGCDKSPKLIWHKKYQCWYGSRCEFHYKEHRLELSAKYSLRHVLSNLSKEEQQCLINARKTMQVILSCQKGFRSQIVSPLASEELGRLKTSLNS